MGLDLSLLPVKYEHEHKEWTTFSCLWLDRDYELFDAIRAAAIAHPVPVPTFGPFGEDGLDITADKPKDAYGAPLTYATAGDLARGSISPRYGKSSWNAACWALLAAMDPDAKILLYWR